MRIFLILFTIVFCLSTISVIGGGQSVDIKTTLEYVSTEIAEFEPLKTTNKVLAIYEELFEMDAEIENNLNVLRAQNRDDDPTNDTAGIVMVFRNIWRILSAIGTLFGCIVVFVLMVGALIIDIFRIGRFAILLFGLETPSVPLPT